MTNAMKYFMLATLASGCTSHQIPGRSQPDAIYVNRTGAAISHFVRQGHGYRSAVRNDNDNSLFFGPIDPEVVKWMVERRPFNPSKEFGSNSGKRVVLSDYTDVMKRDQDNKPWLMTDSTGKPLSIIENGQVVTNFGLPQRFRKNR